MVETCASSSVPQMLEAAKLASAKLAMLSSEEKNSALSAIATALEVNADSIVRENEKDMQVAKLQVEKGELKESLFQRLKLDQQKLLANVAGIRQIASMDDPIGKVTLARELDENLNLYRINCPIGVVAVIFESRPEAMPQILSLCLKTGNAVVLKGGAEAEKSNRILFDTMQKAAAAAGVPAEAFALIETRADVKQLLQADALVDLVIPRGSNELVRHIQANTRIPVLGHADGICHIYIDSEADIEMACKVTVDSKVQYPSACNAVETVLIHDSMLSSVLPRLSAALQSNAVELRLDKRCTDALRSHSRQSSGAASSLDLELIRTASDEDWCTEYCDLIVSIKAVDSMQDAIKHINRYGSGHTDCMISSNRTSFGEFFAQVNSAGVFLNASTRFADGFRYGFGAEVGISTARLHPRGPVGVEGLVTYKYKLLGTGQNVAEYSGPEGKKFRHRDLPAAE